ncbi:hypothetical protein ACGFNP_25595 [Nonomuraea sp. NPDC049269]
MTEVLRRARRLLGLAPANPAYKPRHAKPEAASPDYDTEPLERAS